MRLHNRQLKATFWNDPDLLQWPREKRWFYAGLVQLADDSACLEDSPFAFKLNIFPSPQDNDLTVEKLICWRDELVADKKLLSYSAHGKQCLYLANFHKHQKLKNPSAPEIPLPAWVEWIPAHSNPKAGKYVIKDDVLNHYLESSYEVLTDVLESSDDILMSFFQPEPEPEPERNTDDDDNARAREEVNISEAPQGVEEKQVQEVCHNVANQAIAFAKQNFGRALLPRESQKILDWCTQFANNGSPDADSIVVEGLKRCVDYDSRTLSYLKGIMQDWLSHGVSKLEHIAARDAEWAAQKERRRPVLESVLNQGGGGRADAKIIGNTGHNDSGHYDPSAWERAGFAVSGGT